MPFLVPPPEDMFILLPWSGPSYLLSRKVTWVNADHEVIDRRPPRETIACCQGRQGGLLNAACGSVLRTVLFALKAHGSPRGPVSSMLAQCWVESTRPVPFNLVGTQGGKLDSWLNKASCRKDLQLSQVLPHHLANDPSRKNGDSIAESWFDWSSAGNFPRMLLCISGGGRIIPLTLFRVCIYTRRQ